MRSKLLTSLLLFTFISCVLLFVFIIASSSSATVEAKKVNTLSAHHDNVKFRCFRPFSSLRTFSPKDMTRRDNCEFAPFMKIVDAQANVKCYDEDGQDEGSTTTVVENNGNNADPRKKEGCYVTLNFTAQKFDPDYSAYYPPSQFEFFFQEKEQQGRHLDAMRYTMELKAVGSSTVRYKGFDNEGYSVCCSMLKNKKKQNDEITEICEWVDSVRQQQNSTDDNSSLSSPKVQKLTSKTSCPLNNDADYNVKLIDGKRVYSNLIHGEVERPLHRKIFGKWEARIEFYRDTTDEGVGRLLIPFELSPAIHGDSKERVFQNSAASSSSVTKGNNDEVVMHNEGAVIAVEKKD